MKRCPFVMIALMLCLPCFRIPVVAQDGDAAVTSRQKADGQLTFFSNNEVRFFLYLNGKLQNDESTGRITLTDLEDKPYHIRIVMDDPFEVATTRTMRPGKAPEEYIVDFNPVQERIHISRHKTESTRDAATAFSSGSRDRSRPDRNKDKEIKEKHLSKKAQAEAKAAKASTGKDIKFTKTPFLEEE